MESTDLARFAFGNYNFFVSPRNTEGLWCGDTVCVSGGGGVFPYGGANERRKYRFDLGKTLVIALHRSGLVAVSTAS